MAKKQNKNCKNCNNNICQCKVDQIEFPKGGIVNDEVSIIVPEAQFTIIPGYSQELLKLEYSSPVIEAEVIEEPTYVPFQVNETKFKDKYFQRLILKPIRDIAKLPAIKVSIEAAVEKYGKYELINELQSIVDRMLVPGYKEDVWGLSNTKCIADREVNKYRKNLIAELTGFTSTCNNCGEQTWVDNCRIFVAIIFLLED